MKRLGLGFALVSGVLVAACGSVESGSDAGQQQQADASVNGVDSSPNGPDASLDCTPDTTTCTNDTLTVCGSDGVVESTTACDFGCASATGPCSDLAPSNNLGDQLDMAESGPDIVFDPVSGDTTINSDTGDVMHNGAPVTIPSTVKTQSGAPSVRVFRVNSLAIRNNVIVSGANAIAFVSNGDVEIGALIQVAARWKQPGPGAFVGTSSCNGSDSSAVDPTGANTRVPGAGGGGFGLAGGGGGSAKKSVYLSGGATGGGVAGTVDLQPLRGGCRGGNVNSPQDAYWVNEGGGGGGALQISSRGTITVTEAGVIDAGGGGADFGKTGSGGGAGGAILLEGLAVVINGKLGANGGAGTCFNWDGENGRTDYGTDGLLGAMGGNCTEANGIGDGGIGGSKDNAAGTGGNGTHNTAVPIGGGGGGAVGRIRINTVSGDATLGGSSLVSPLPSKAEVTLR